VFSVGSAPMIYITRIQAPKEILQLPVRRSFFQAVHVELMTTQLTGSQAGGHFTSASWSTLRRRTFNWADNWTMSPTNQLLHVKVIVKVWLRAAARVVSSWVKWREVAGRLKREFSCQLSWKSPYEEMTRRLMWNGRQPGTQLAELPWVLHGRLWEDDQRTGRWIIFLRRSHCQKTASGKCNKLNTLVCVGQWAVKCSTEWCVQMVNKLIRQSKPHLQSNSKINIFLENFKTTGASISVSNFRWHAIT
jgi:hypothetical protein